jgi:FkbM family methyltransferase
MVNTITDKIISNATLRQQLSSLIQPPQTSSSSQHSRNLDVILTPNEVNRRHGTGTILINIFAQQQNLFSLRFDNQYESEHDLGLFNHRLSIAGKSRAEVFAEMLSIFEGIIPQRILCVPFHPEELSAAIAIKELFDIPLCIYIMDDNNLYSEKKEMRPISHELMREALEKSSLRLAISPELRKAYEHQYRLKFWLLPPVVASNLIEQRVNHPESPSNAQHRGILVGNIWSQKYLDCLRETVRNSNLKIDWYCNSYANPKWLSFERENLKNDGIKIYPPLKESELVEQFKNYSFAIIPSGKLDESDNIQNIARLSLPSRVPFILATSQTPFIVLGSEETAVARFVKRFEVGLVSDYNSTSFKEVVSQIVISDVQGKMRQNAAAIADLFTSDGISQWLWESLEKGEPIDLKFEKLMPYLPNDFAYFVEPPCPKNIWPDFIPVYQGLKRLKDKGFNPDFVIDVGASTGVWSDTIDRVYPQARFILLDPLLSRYAQEYQEARKHMIDRHANFEVVEALVSNQTGRQMMSISADLYNSSIYQIKSSKLTETVEVEVITLDWLAQERSITGRGLLKLDVQFAEHLVIEGASQFLPQVDVCIIELSLWKYQEETKTLLEMLEIMSQLGFRYYDEVGEWRLPEDGGTLREKDILFVRKNLFLTEGQLV